MVTREVPPSQVMGGNVAFESAATNLVSVDINGQNDVFVRDRETGIITLVSVDSAGVQTNGVSKNYPIPISISGDGRFVVFTSQATNLVSGDYDPQIDRPHLLIDYYVPR